MKLRKFLTAYNASLRALYLAECYNPQSPHYQQRYCVNFIKSLNALVRNVTSSCLEATAYRYPTASCAAYREQLYTYLKLNAPKVKLREPSKPGAPRVVSPTPGVVSRTTPPVTASPKLQPPFKIFGLIAGGSNAISGSKSYGAASISCQIMFSRNFGTEIGVEFDASPDPLDGTVPPKVSRFSFSALWFLGGGVKHTGFSFYVKGGVVQQELTQDTETLDSAVTLQLGGGVQLRLATMFSLNLEVMGIAPTPSNPDWENHEMHAGSIQFRFNIGFHFDNPLFYLLTPLLFV
ncbi:hypothetical protein KJ865_07060 [Myxococcota bacterium]|nr:hypothetical protein [Myxococcota bacterium]